MQNYLYILPFIDGKHFKIGISSKDFTRIKHLNSLYNIDLDKALIVSSSKRNISLLERELLQIFDKDECDDFNSDGHTEIRHIKYLDECISIIDSKHKNLKYVYESIDLTNVLSISESKVRDRNHTNKLELNKKYIFDIITFLSSDDINRFMSSMEFLFDNSIKISRLEYADAYMYDLTFNSDVEVYRNFINNDLKITLETETDISYRSDLFGLISSMTSHDEIISQFIIRKNVNRVQKFSYKSYKFESNDDTIQLVEIFKKVLELRYYCYNFNVKYSLNDLIDNKILSKPIDYQFLDKIGLYKPIEDKTESFVLSSDEEIEKYIKKEIKNEKKIAKLLEY